MLRKIDIILKQLDPGKFTELATYKVPTPTMVLGIQLICIFFGKTPDKSRKQGWTAPDPNGWFDCGKTQLLNDAKGLHRDLCKYDK